MAMEELAFPWLNQQGGPLRGDRKGEFKNDNIDFLALSLNWKFQPHKPNLRR